MTDSFIQLPSDSTGKQLDTVIVNMGAGTTQVHREKVVVADPASTSAFATVTSSQGLQVSSTQAQTISGTVTVLSASSGFVRAFHIGGVTSSGLSAFHAMSTGGAVATNITTAPSAFYGYSIFNSSVTMQTVKFYNSTAPIVGGSTANLMLSVMAPGSTGGGGANLTLPVGLYSSLGWSYIITANLNDTDTGAPGTNNISVGMFYQT